MSLLDVLKKRKSGLGIPQSAGEIATKSTEAATGKAVGPQTGPQMSNIGAQQSAAAAKSTEQQQAVKQTLAATELAKAADAQTEQFKLASEQQRSRVANKRADLVADEYVNKSSLAAQDDIAIQEMTSREKRANSETVNRYSEALADLASSRGIAEQEIFEWVRQEQERLGADRTKAWLEQTVHMMAMSDNKYLHQIRQVGATNRLTESLKFAKEATKLQFGQDLELLQNKLDSQSILNANEREMRLLLSEMDIDTALAMANQAVREQAYAGAISGTTEVLTSPEVLDQFKNWVNK
jgi:hypothetical protein